LRQGPRFGLVAELFQRVRLEVLGGLVVGVREHGVVDDFGDPAVVAELKRAAGLVQQCVGAAHELDVAFGGVLGRERVQVGGVAVKPAEVVDVGGLDVVVERSVVATHRPVAVELRGELDQFGDLDRGVAVVGQPERLVVDEAVAVASFVEDLEDSLTTPHGPVVHAVHRLGAVAPELDRLFQVL
jgi:hypothetical protein